MKSILYVPMYDVVLSMLATYLVRRDVWRISPVDINARVYVVTGKYNILWWLLLWTGRKNCEAILITLTCNSNFQPVLLYELSCITSEAAAAAADACHLCSCMQCHKYNLTSYISRIHCMSWHVFHYDLVLCLWFGDISIPYQKKLWYAFWYYSQLDGHLPCTAECGSKLSCGHLCQGECFGW